MPTTWIGPYPAMPITEVQKVSDKLGPILGMRWAETDGKTTLQIRRGYGEAAWEDVERFIVVPKLCKFCGRVMYDACTTDKHELIETCIRNLKLDLMESEKLRAVQAKELVELRRTVSEVCRSEK